MQAFVGFLNNPRETRARAGTAPLAPVREDQLEALEVQTRLVAVLFQGFAQLRRTRGVHQARQRPNDLRFGVVQVRKLVEVQILQ